jgi:hypothetical protein
MNPNIHCRNNNTRHEQYGYAMSHTIDVHCTINGQRDNNDEWQWASNEAFLDGRCICHGG